MSGSKPRQSATTVGSGTFPPAGGTSTEQSVSGADPSLACPVPAGCGGEGPLTWAEMLWAIEPLLLCLRKQPRRVLAGMLEDVLVGALASNTASSHTRQEQISEVERFVDATHQWIETWKAYSRPVNRRALARLVAEIRRADRGLPPKRRKRRKPRRAV